MSMTVEEAKSYMENEIRCIQRASYCDRDCAKCNLVKEEKPLLEAYGVAIQSFEEIQQYRAIGTVSEFRELMEKATAKKPIFKFEYDDGTMFYDCPVCGAYVLHVGVQSKGEYCSHCGTALDWSEGKE